MKNFNFKVIDILALGGDSAGGAIAGEGGVFYSESFPVSDATYNFEYQCTSDGDVAVKLELEQSNEEPETEGAQDDNFVVPDDALELDDSLDDELVHIKAYAPSATKFARVKATGLAGNDASTVLSSLRMTAVKS